MPSGEYGGVPTPALLPKEEQQAEMYNALTPLFNHVTTRRRVRRLQAEAVGAGVRGRSRKETVPHAGVTILRDSYNVPHIYGVTRDDVTWGAGWVVAEDRGLLLNEARYISLLAAIDAPGLSAISLIGNLASFKPTAQTENEVAKQTNVLLAARRQGAGCAARHRRLPARASTRTTSIHSPSTPRVHPDRRLRAQRAQGPVRRRGRRPAGDQRASSSHRCSAGLARRRDWRSGTTCARPTTLRPRSACPVTSASSRRRRARAAT